MRLARACEAAEGYTKSWHKDGCRRVALVVALTLYSTQLCSNHCGVRQLRAERRVYHCQRCVFSHWVYQFSKVVNQLRIELLRDAREYARVCVCVCVGGGSSSLQSQKKAMRRFTNEA